MVQEGDAVTLHGLEKRPASFSEKYLERSDVSSRRPDLNGCSAEVLRVADPSQSSAQARFLFQQLSSRAKHGSLEVVATCS